jgi:uncharacterized protein (DUF1778 family)
MSYFPVNLPGEPDTQLITDALERQALCTYNVSTNTLEPRMPSQTKVERVALRLAAADKVHLSRAAKLQGRTLSEFMLAASREAADLALNEQTRFVLSPEALRKFAAALDAPPRDVPALRKLFASPSVLER